MTVETPVGDLLKGKGLRSTAQRRAVLTALRGRPHSTAADLETRVGAAGGLSRQGLYNVLDDLTKAELVRCIEPAGSPARYELRVGDNHHHLVCRGCGAIADVDGHVDDGAVMRAARRAGFAPDDAQLVVRGLCATCRAAGADAAAA